MNLCDILSELLTVSFLGMVTIAQIWPDFTGMADAEFIKWGQVIHNWVDDDQCNDVKKLWENGWRSYSASYTDQVRYYQLEYVLYVEIGWS